jgi:hypothetical protein
VIRKVIRRRFGLHARRVAVRTQIPGYLRWFGVTFVAVATVVLLWIAYGQVRGGLQLRDADGAVRRLSHDNSEMERANAGMKSELSVLERQLQIERATYADLLHQIKDLSRENARLKEDVALMQAISAPEFKLDGVKISSVRVEPNSVAGEYSYRIVLLQTGSRTKTFQGSYQLVVSLTQDGKRAGVTVPASAQKNEAPYQLDFRVHQRIDGTFKVDPAAVVRSVELRVFEGGQSQPKAMQTVTLS